MTTDANRFDRNQCKTTGIWSGLDRMISCVRDDSPAEVLVIVCYWLCQSPILLTSSTRLQMQSVKVSSAPDGGVVRSRCTLHRWDTYVSSIHIYHRPRSIVNQATRWAGSRERETVLALIENPEPYTKVLWRFLRAL